MATASGLIAIAQERVGDPDGDHLTFAEALKKLNEAQRKFSSGAWLLERRKGQTVSARQDRFAYPDELVMLEGVWLLKSIERELDWVDVEEYRRRVSNVRTDTGQPRIYTLYEREVRVWPRLSKASDQTTLESASANDAATTTLSVASTGIFKSAGRAVVGAEEFEYTDKTATTFTGVRRGTGGTSAASHATGATVKEVDLELWYRRTPASIATGSDSPEIPEVWHEYLIPYMLYLELKALGRNEEADEQLRTYAALENEAKNNVKRRQIAKLPRIRERRIRG